MTRQRARRYVDRLDQARSRRLIALFGADWRDITRYELALNVARLAVADAVRIIVEAARAERFRPTAASEQDFKDLALASRVEASLITSARFRNIGVTVGAAKGDVHLSGVLAYSVAEEEIVRLVKSVPGVNSVTTDFTVLPLEDHY